MPKIRITRLPKAQNGLTTGTPCGAGYIKVDGQCIEDASRNFQVWETNVPGEYTKKPSIGKTGLLSNVSVKSSGDRSPSAGLPNGYDPTNDPEVLAASGDMLNSINNRNSVIDRFARGRDAVYNQDFKQNFGNVAGTGLNWLRNLLYAPGAGVVTALQGLRGDQNLIEQNPNSNTQAALDVTGMSNYPYLQKSAFETLDAYGNLINQPSLTNVGSALLGTLGTALNAVGSVPIIGGVERGLTGAVSREVPTLTSKLAPAFTKEALRKTFKPNLNSKNFAQFVANTPVINEGLGLGNQLVHTMDNVMGAPYRFTQSMVNPLVKKAGVKLTDPHGFTPWIYGEHMWDGLTGSNPVQNAQDYFLNPTATQTGMSSAYSENTNNLMKKDTVINLQSPSGKIYSINTGSPEFKNISNLIDRSDANYDPKTQTFKLNQNNFSNGDSLMDVDDFMTEMLPKKAYGGMKEIPRLFKYSPERNAPGRMAYSGVPKFVAGGTPPNCDPGYMVDPNDANACIPDPNYVPRVGITPNIGNYSNTAPAGFSKDYGTGKFAPTLDQTGMPAGFDWNAGNTDIQGNSLNPSAPVNPDPITPYKMDPNQTTQNVGLFKCPTGQHKDQKTGQCVPDNIKQKVNDGLDNFADKYNKIATPLAKVANMYTNYRKQNEWNKTNAANNLSDNRFVAANTNHGLTEDPNNGLRRNNYGQIGYKFNNQASGYGEYGGTMSLNNGIRIRITGGPVGKDTEQMAYGGQSGYGFDLGQRNTYAAMPEGKIQTVSKQIKEVPREEANIEAEKGETVYGDVNGDGQPEHMDIGGKRHVDGGTPLNVPEGSFIFSDTKNMRIKDEASLSKFGLSPRKEGYTPAEIAKKYDINKYKAILEDPNSDELMKNTAQLMMKNYKKKLAELALIQESIKGFPQGIPEMCRGVLPEELLAKIDEQLEKEGKQKPKFEQGSSKLSGDPNQQPNPEEYSEESMQGNPMQDQMMMGEEPSPEMMYGGSYGYGGDFNHFEQGGQHLDKYQIKGQVTKKPATLPTYQPTYADKLNQLETDKYNVVRPQVGYTPSIAAVQHKTKTGVYGAENYWDAAHQADFNTRFGDDFLKNHPGWNPTKQGQTRLFQDWYTENVDSTYFSGEGPYKKDDMFGGHTYNAAPWKKTPPPPPGTVSGFKCTGRGTDGTPTIESKEFASEAERTAAGYHADQATAGRECTQPVTKPGPKYVCVKDPKTGATTTKVSPTGFDSPEEALKHCPGGSDIPFDYMTPDKWKMNAVRSRRLNKYLPYIADVPYEASNYLPEEWRAKAAELQSQTNDATRAMSAMGTAQGFGANVSNIQGKQARNLVGAIADVDARNVQGYNAFNRGEMARRDQFNALRASNATERAKGNAIANQYYDNAYNKNLDDQVNVDANAWTNRMQLDAINNTNRFYYTDPYRGQFHYKGGYGPDNLGGKYSNGSLSTSPDDFKKFQNEYGADKTWKDYLDMKRYQSKIPTDTVKYGGAAGGRQSNNSVNLGDMLSRGYGFPF